MLFIHILKSLIKINIIKKLNKNNRVLMKQKAKRIPNSKLEIKKKKIDFSLLDSITNKLLLGDSPKIGEENNLTKYESKPKNKNKNKIQYDPIIFKMIQNHNSKKWKSNIVFCISEFLTFEESLSLRIVCKMFNSGIESRYLFLKENILFTNNNKIHEKIRKEYKINKKKNLILLNEIAEGQKNSQITRKEKEMNALLFNKRKTGNFSKKQLFITMVNNKNYMSIKSKLKKGEFSMPKNLNF